jgi:Zn-dependent membrane protease YugP
MSGAEIAEKMLADNGFVMCAWFRWRVNWQITTIRLIKVNLSEAVYNQRNAAAAAVAAHECGHAVQHAVGYQWLTMRSKLVP